MNVTILSGKQNKKQRDALKVGLKNGTYKLRVYGSEAKGFRLAAQVDENNAIAFGFVATQQGHAVTIGIKKYGQKAVKISSMTRRTKKIETPVETPVEAA